MEIINYPYFFNAGLVTTALEADDLIMIGREDKSIEGGYRTFIGKASDLFPAPPAPYVKPYKSIVLKISQSGAKAPDLIATLENDFSATVPVITLSYLGPGQYQINCLGAFPDVNKVVFLQKSIGRYTLSAGPVLNAAFVDLQWNDQDSVVIYTFEDHTDTINGLMTLHDIEIRVYP